MATVSVNFHTSKTPWRGVIVDLCDRCKGRRGATPFSPKPEPDFVAWSDRILATKYPKGEQ